MHRRLEEKRHEKIVVWNPCACCIDQRECRERRGYGAACKGLDAATGVELVGILRGLECWLRATLHRGTIWMEQ